MRKFRVWSILLLSIMLIWWAWGRISTPWGDQKVFFMDWRKDCFSSTTAPAFKSCIYESPMGSSESLVYYFHGKDLDENTWNDQTFYTGMIQYDWELRKKKPPKIATISFGKIWLMTSTNDKLHDVFINTAMPLIEQRVGAIKHRLVMGESMGGVNSLLVSLRNPKLFEKVVSLCPPLYSIGPHSSIGEMLALVKRTGAYPFSALTALQVGRIYVDRQEDSWQVSPLELLKRAESNELPSIYLSADFYDRYGIFEGAKQFFDIARSKGVKIEWRPLYGGHCAVDVISVSQFLTDLD